MGKAAILILVKNPTGLNQSLALVAQDDRSKNLFIALNDNAADGRDISWIWDAEAEIIAARQELINQVVCSGQRSGDMAVRIKYAGLEVSKIIIQSSLLEGLELTINKDGKVSYILCTYTALFAVRKILFRMQKKYPSSEAESEKMIQTAR